MRSFAHSIFILLSLLFAFSCSQKQTGVKLEISNNFVFGGSGVASISKGGLMVWGRNGRGQAFGQSLEDSDEIQLQLDPGAWTFYAMAWDGTTNYDGSAASPGTDVIFGGKPRCAKSPVTKLESAAVAIDLVLDNNTCDDPAFSGGMGTTNGGTYKVLPELKLNFCSKIGIAITSASHKCADTFNDPARVAGKGTVSSFRVSFRNFTGPARDRNLLPGGIKGECVVFNGDNEGAPAAPALYGTSQSVIPGLPAGGLGYPFHMTLEMYPGSTSCENTGAGFRGVITKELVNGASFELPGSNKYFAAGGKYRQYVEVSPYQICATRSGSFADHPFAGGDGSPDRPYLICSVPQFHAINSFVDSDSNGVNDHFSKSFKLQSNLDFNPFSKGIAANYPALFECLELGSNFLPIGYDGANCAGAGNPMSWGTITPFTGNFFGANFTIKNLRLRQEDKDYIGLFADFQGSYLSEIRFDKTELSGKQYVGGLAGNLQGSVQVRNIFGNRMNIEARDDSVAFSKVGSIFGAVQSGDLKNIIVKDSKVRGESSYVGGLAGFTNGTIVTEVAIEADIDANSSANKTDVGGLIGSAVSTILQFVKHEGGIYTNATKVGGILGSATLGTTLTDFYAISHLMTYQSSAAQIGGVVGEWNSGAGANLERGYTLSIVRSKCDPSCNEGAITGANTTTPAGTAKIYTLPDVESLAVATNMGNEFELSGLTDIRTPSSVPDLNVAGWNIVSNEYPRFVFEQHPCHQTGFSGSGAGTLLSPKIVCNDLQYMSLASATSGTYHKLVSNIRLPNIQTGLFELPTFDAILLGNDKSLIGGYSFSSFTGATAHIQTLNAGAVITDLKLHGMGRRTSDTSNNHGVFVANNYGTIQNIEAWVYPQWINQGALVGTNMTGGTISNVSIDGIYKGRNNIATIAVENQGIIKDIETSGEFYCIEGAGCSEFAGLVDQNSGTILKAEMGSRIEVVAANPVISASMIVTNNSGDLTDIYVSQHADFKIAGSEAYYYHKTNSGTLTRVFNAGKLFKISNSVPNTTPAYITNFPTETTAVDAGTGTHTDVLRTGARSGIDITQGTLPFTCQTTSVLRVSDFATIPFATWRTYLDGLPYLSSSKNLIVDVKLSSGDRFRQRVSAYNSTLQDFTIPTANCNTPGGEVEIYYTNDLSFNSSTGASTAGTLPPQYASSVVFYGTNWRNYIWDMSDAADFDEMMAYYSFLLGFSTTPVSPVPWVLEDEGLELFEKN